ncbi:hypothetical protein MMC09_006806 [Bachmanniomyces sp. S44760]|nr:hypothetical protein [Bachmanniomyces sp. S44760]
MDYALSDQTWTPQDPIQTIIPYRPHRFWPCPSATEDSTILIWAHPSNAESAMDGLFFMNLLRWISDVKDPAVDVGIDIFQLSLLEEVSATTLIWFPKANWLGSLRWMMPFALERSFAAVGKMLGYEAVMEKYTLPEDWAKYQEGKKQK